MDGELSDLFATAPLRPEQIGYLAGLFDGEGCVRVRNNGWNGVVSVHISNTNREVLEWCRRLTGLGFVYVGRRKLYKSAVARVLYIWEMSPRHAQKFLEMVRPYSIIKLDEIDVALRIQSLTVRGSGQNVAQRRILKQKLHDLKRRGEYIAA